MRLTRLILKNFGSIADLEFDFSNLGLTLLSGRSKSGKSTLMDSIYWTLYGLTSKDSNADDVRSWFAENQVTQSELTIEHPKGDLTVTRIRGNPTQNDLYWVDDSDRTQHRGKNMIDTQKLLAQRLGASDELYAMGAYLHQFSTADMFFVAKPKERRAVAEKLVDLSLPIKLAASASTARKIAKEGLQASTQAKAKAEGAKEQLEASRASMDRSMTSWERTRASQIVALEESAKSFDQDKQERLDAAINGMESIDKQIVPRQQFIDKHVQITTQLQVLDNISQEYETELQKLQAKSTELKIVESKIDSLNAIAGATCPTCLTPMSEHHRQEHTTTLASEAAALEAELNTLALICEKLAQAVDMRSSMLKGLEKNVADEQKNERLIERFEDKKAAALAVRSSTNNFEKQIIELKSQKNPFLDKLDEIQYQTLEVEATIGNRAKECEFLEDRISKLTWLHDKSYALRGMMIARAIEQLNDKTNKYLERYFEADIRVSLSLAESDELDVEIQNKGYKCSFKQLCGGERRILSFCFNIALMLQAQNAAGIKFSTLFFDESLNHLDSLQKVSAFGLLQDLSQEFENVFLVEHSEEFKTLFENKFIVTNDGTHSTITREEF